VIITGLPSAALEAVLKRLKEFGVTPGGDLDDLIGSKISNLDKNWFSALQENLVFVPVNLVPSIPPQYSLRIILVDTSAEEGMRYLMEKVRPGAQAFNQELIDNVSFAERQMRTWISQQPDLDVIYVHDASEINSDLLKQFATQI
jgi:hypothetical protein